ncbi:MAG: hypothetical protein WDN27_05685 [Candidatus Saccharibacteria bacterium]
MEALTHEPSSKSGWGPLRKSLLLISLMLLATGFAITQAYPIYEFGVPRDVSLSMISVGAIMLAGTSLGN